MSQLRSTRGKKKALPELIPVSMKSTETRKILFPLSSTGHSNSSQEDEIEMEQTKKRKIRRTQNSFYINSELESATPGTEISSKSNSKTTRKIRRKTGKKLIPCDIEAQSSSDDDFACKKTSRSSKKAAKSAVKLRLPRIELGDFDEGERDSKIVKKELEKEKSKGSNDDEEANDLNEIITLGPREKIIQTKKIKQSRDHNDTKISRQMRKSITKNAITNNSDESEDILSKRGDNSDSAIINSKEEELHTNGRKSLRKISNLKSHTKSNQHEESEENKENIISTKEAFQDFDLCVSYTNNGSETEKEITGNISEHSIKRTRNSSYVQKDKSMTQYNENLSKNESSTSDSDICSSSKREKRHSRTNKLLKKSGNPEASTSGNILITNIQEKYENPCADSEFKEDEGNIEYSNISTSSGRSKRLSKTMEKSEISSSKVKTIKGNNRNSGSVLDSSSSSKHGQRISSNEKSFRLSEKVEASTSRSRMIQEVQDSSSDSEIEFNACSNMSQKTLSDFDFKTRNIEGLNLIPEEDSSPKCELDMECDSVKQKSDCIGVDQMNNLHILTNEADSNSCQNKSTYSDIPKDQIAIFAPEKFQKNADVKENLDAKTGRKRWTVFAGIEARRSFRIQIEKLSAALPLPQSPENSLPNCHLRLPRRSSRKRWSDELRKSSSAVDVSIACAATFDFKKDTLEKEKSSVSEANDTKSSGKSRRSRSLTHTPEKSSPEKMCKRHKSTPFVKNARSASFSDGSSDQNGDDTFVMEDTFDDINLLELSSVKPSGVTRHSRSISVSDASPEKHRKIFRATPNPRKSKPAESFGGSIRAMGEDTIETGDSINNTQLMQSTSTKTSNDEKDSKSPGAILKRRGTYELDKSITDINVLKSLSESNLSDLGHSFSPDTTETFNKSKRVRFENVTKRKKQNRNDIVDGSGGEHVKPIVEASAKKARFKISVGGTKSVSFDHTIFSPPSSSSTPKITSKTPTLLKQVLTKEKKGAPLVKRRSKSADGGFNRVSRIKMPNFAKIHQRATDRLEDIEQMTARKAERARLLLSGQKPTAETSSYMSSNSIKETEVKRSKRQLPFDTSAPSTSISSLKSSPKKRQISVKSKNMEVPASAKNTEANQKVAVATRIPISSETKTGPTKGGFIKVVIPENLKNLARSAPIKKPMQSKTTQFGFKMRSNAVAVNKTEQIKAVVTKSKPQQNNREERRNVLKGVRGNRRFELLMNMRKN